MTRVFTITLNPAIDHTVRLQTLVPGQTHRALGEQREAGGKGVGVASVLAGLGVPVSASGWLGADNASLFESTFARRGIDDAMVRVPGLTRTNIKLTDTVRGDTTDINLPGFPLSLGALASAEADLLALLAARVQPGDWCELAGSLPPDANVDNWVRIARRTASWGARLLIDTGGDALRQVLTKLQAEGGADAVAPTFIKPNLSELEELAGRTLQSLPEVADAADALCDKGVQYVIVSLGGNGAVIVCAEGRWHATAPRVPVLTTVGAGDALVAGTLASLIDGAAFPKAALFGIACAAARIQQIAPDLPPRQEIDRLVSAITLSAL